MTLVIGLAGHHRRHLPGVELWPEDRVLKPTKADRVIVAIKFCSHNTREIAQRLYGGRVRLVHGGLSAIKRELTAV
jgi:hypothetical protein